MNKATLNFAGALALALVTMPVSAVVMFDQNVTNNAIMGTDITNGSFTVDRANSVELGLRAKLRHDAAGDPQNIFNSNGDGTYSFAAGVAPTQVVPTAVWSFEWSINVNYDGVAANRRLDDLTYALGIDTDPGAGTSYGPLVPPIPNPFDPINVACADHSFGDNGTLQSQGVEAGPCPASAAIYGGLISSNTLAQNSWKPHWFIDGFDADVDGQYDFYLAAFDASGQQLARTDISVIVGDGVSVSAPATLAMAALGMLLLSGLRRRR